MTVVCLSKYFAVLVVLTVELLPVLPVDAGTTENEETDKSVAPIRSRDSGLSGNVSWWAESVSLALGDLAARALGHDQLQQLYDNSVCVTSLSSDDVNVSQHVLDAAAAFGRFIFANTMFTRGDRSRDGSPRRSSRVNSA